MSGSVVAHLGERVSMVFDAFIDFSYQASAAYY